MRFRVLTGIGMLVTLVAVQEAAADAPTTVKVDSAQGVTATKQAKIVIELVNPGTNVLDGSNPWLKTLIIDGVAQNTVGLNLEGGNQTTGRMTWTVNGTGPAPGDHTVQITVNLASGGTATMTKAVKITFAN